MFWGYSMSRKIVFTSGKGGVGKSTCVALIAYYLASFGAKVVAMDMDIGLNNLDVMVGIEHKITYDIVDVLEQKCRLKQALVQDAEIDKLYFLPSINSGTSRYITASNLVSMMADLDNMFDYCLIDCPAGIKQEFYNSIFCSSEAIVVTTPHIISVRDASKVIDLLFDCNISNPTLIVNRITKDMNAKNAIFTANDIAEVLDIQLLGAIQESEAINQNSTMYGNLYKLTESQKIDFFNIAKTIHFNKLGANFYGKNKFYK